MELKGWYDKRQLEFGVRGARVSDLAPLRMGRIWSQRMLQQTDLNPASLVDRIAAGDPAAEDQFVRHYLPTLTFILKTRFSDHDQVQDLVQETLMGALQNLREGKLRDADALSGYVHAIAMNKCHEFLRGVYRRGVTVDVEQAQVAADKDVFDGLEQSELARIVRQCVASLPTRRDRELIRQFYYYDVDKAELCDRFGISSAHFDRVSFRARQRLRELVEKRTKSPLAMVTLLVLLTRGRAL